MIETEWKKDNDNSCEVGGICSYKILAKVHGVARGIKKIEYKNLFKK